MTCRPLLDRRHRAKWPTIGKQNQLRRHGDAENSEGRKVEHSRGV